MPFDQAKIGNLAPGSGATIRLTYVTELKVEGGEVRFYLPTTIAPRYIPATDNSTAAADLASINYTSSVALLNLCQFRAESKCIKILQEIRLQNRVPGQRADGIDHRRHPLTDPFHFGDQ